MISHPHATSSSPWTPFVPNWKDWLEACLSTKPKIKKITHDDNRQGCCWSWSDMCLLLKTILNECKVIMNLDTNDKLWAKDSLHHQGLFYWQTSWRRSPHYPYTFSHLSLIYSSTETIVKWLLVNGYPCIPLFSLYPHFTSQETLLTFNTIRDSLKRLSTEAALLTSWEFVVMISCWWDYITCKRMIKKHKRSWMRRL
jgi:hypothetical protein